MTYRALELLNLPEGEPAFLLDIGCGSGLSGEILDEEGYLWVGVDVAPSMLGAYSQRSFVPVRPLTFHKRSRLSAKSRATCSSRTSVRASASDQVVLTAQSGTLTFRTHLHANVLTALLSPSSSSEAYRSYNGS